MPLIVNYCTLSLEQSLSSVEMVYWKDIPISQSPSLWISEPCSTLSQAKATCIRCFLIAIASYQRGETKRCCITCKWLSLESENFGALSKIVPHFQSRTRNMKTKCRLVRNEEIDTQVFCNTWMKGKLQFSSPFWKAEPHKLIYGPRKEGDGRTVVWFK